jgi:hypothetical protein
VLRKPGARSKSSHGLDSADTSEHHRQHAENGDPGAEATSGRDADHDYSNSDKGHDSHGRKKLRLYRHGHKDCLLRAAAAHRISAPNVVARIDQADL